MKSAGYKYIPENDVCPVIPGLTRNRINLKEGIHYDAVTFYRGFRVEGAADQYGHYFKQLIQCKHHRIPQKPPGFPVSDLSAAETARLWHGGFL
jgi:hypothetical protein